MNRTLRRALADADLTEVDVAVRCEIDPKAVQACLSYPANVHTRGLAAAQAPMFRIRAAPGRDVACPFLGSFEHVFDGTQPHYLSQAIRRLVLG